MGNTITFLKLANGLQDRNSNLLAVTQLMEDDW
jgi:hypothetical protein